MMVKGHRLDVFSPSGLPHTIVQELGRCLWYWQVSSTKEDEEDSDPHLA